MSHGLREHDSMFSVSAVRRPPWHGLGVVLDEYPESIDDALEKAGLTWAVNQGDIFVAVSPVQGGGIYVPQLESHLVPAEGYRANIREDTGEVLGVVTDDYRVVPNRDAFAWLDELLGGAVQFETAGSLGNGRRVWVLARIPETVEVGGDETATYIYCANSHDGSMAVTAAATKIRIVCANTLGWALRDAETRAPDRVYKFRHVGDMRAKINEARKVLDITLAWDRAFKEIGDRLAQERLTVDAYVERVARPLIGFTEKEEADMREADRKIAIRNRENNLELLVDIFNGAGPEGDTSGNSPGTKWCAANAVAEWADWNRRYTKKTDQMARSFEDQKLKQRGLELVLAA